MKCNLTHGCWTRTACRESGRCLEMPSAEASSKTAGPSGSLRCDAMVGARVESGFFRKFQNGDTVFHRPTGETWSLIADEKDGWVTPGGWPPSQGRAGDCELVERGRQAEDESVRQPSPNIRRSDTP